jgi:hypothetical protein
MFIDPLLKIKFNKGEYLTMFADRNAFVYLWNEEQQFHIVRHSYMKCLQIISDKKIVPVFAYFMDETGTVDWFPNDNHPWIVNLAKDPDEFNRAKDLLKTLVIMPNDGTEKTKRKNTARFNNLKYFVLLIVFKLKLLKIFDLCFNIHYNISE